MEKTQNCSRGDRGEKVYDKTKHIRTFQIEWTSDRPWLMYAKTKCFVTGVGTLEMSEGMVNYPTWHMLKG